ncbi:MAG: diguanylate cyclase [Desulfovibrionaceae bacterium]|nr:diguanylate cyclase [Desulfovibrionaceae bacterium]MBF0514965.1 diguanylate cyclase [Desulfovibrionaceae bacterium]
MSRGISTTFEADALYKLPVGVFILEPDSIVSLWNAVLEEWTGIEAEKIVGLPITEFFPHFGEPYFGERLAGIFAGGPPVVFSAQLHTSAVPCKTRQGKDRRQKTTVIPIGGEGGAWRALGMIQDETDLSSLIAEIAGIRDALRLEIASRTKAEAELRRQNAFLETLLDTIPSPIYYTGPDGRYLSCNKAFEGLFGKTREQIAAKTPEELWPKTTPNFMRQEDDVLLESPGVKRVEAGVRDVAGKYREMILFKASYPDPDGGVGGIVGAAMDITEHKENLRKIEYLAHHDALTGLPNRKLFLERLEHALAGAKRTASLIGLIYIDLDRFKDINDSLGHHAGDQALIEFSRRVLDKLRETDTMARIGGDEFVVIAENIKFPADLSVIAAKIEESLRAPMPLAGIMTQIRASIGVSCHPWHGDDPDALIRAADQDMYQRKKDRRLEE